MNYYEISSNITGELVAKGTARECMEQLGCASIDTFYALANRSRRGVNKKYTVKVKKGGETMKHFIRQIQPYVNLYRDTESGLAWIEDGRCGLGVSVHPNIDMTGSVDGMRARSWWGKDDRVVYSHGFIYNIDRFVCCKADELEMIVADECMCVACQERRSRKQTGKG